MSGKKIIGIIVLLALAAGIIIGVTAIVRENRITALRNEAASMCRQGRYEEAMEIFSRFDDDNAKAWIEKCRQGIAERDAVALAAEGKTAEALALLKAEYPESGRMNEITEARAAELAAEGDAAAAVRLLEEADHPDRYLRETYEEMADEQAFWKYLEEGNTEAALEKYREIKAGIVYPNKETDAKLAEMSQSYEKANAAKLLESGEGFDAFQAYEHIDDKEGMRTALDAMEASGDYLHAFRCEAETKEPDAGRLSRLYDGLTDPDYKPFGDSGFTHFNSGGRLEYYNLDIGSLLTKLLARGGDGEAATLAARIADNIVAECRPLIEEGRRRSRPYRALGELQSRAPSLWTDDMQALEDRCIEMPENGVLAAKEGIEKTPGSPGSASVTVQNKSKTRGVVLRLNRTGKPAEFISVFVRPDSSFGFTVDGGMYEGKTLTGKFWYGSEEYFGDAAETRSVEIRDSRGSVTTTLMNGIYLLNVN